MARADSLIATGMYNEAIELLNRILQYDLDSPEAIWRIGVAFTENKDPRRAVKALEYFFRFDPYHPQALEAYGCAQFKLGNYRRAQDYLELAEKSLPESSSIKRNLGVVYNQIGRKEESLEKFKASYELNPEDYRTEYALAMAYIYFHRYYEAGMLLERMLSQQLPTDFHSLADESYRWVQHRLSGPGEKDTNDE